MAGIPSNDAGALYRVMAECAGDAQKLRTMGKAARKTAERTGWSVYRDRAAQTIREFLQGYVPGTEENKRCSGPRLSD